MMRIGLPTASRGYVREKRRTRAAVDNPQPAGIAPKKPFGTVLTSGATSDWKPNFFTNPKKKVASIPFIRNIVEYTKSDKDPTYIKLTSLLHWKTDTETITQADLDGIFNQLFGTQESSQDGGKKVVQILDAVLAECLVAPEGLNFENKVVMSIAVRLLAEKFMIKKIADNAFVASLDHNQTIRLFKKFKQKFVSDPALDVLQRVVVMTPESIHLNSFMYEPIIDMADKHLRILLEDVKALG